MKIVASVLTYKPHECHRLDLLRDTTRSLVGEADHVIVAYNGSNDDYDWLAAFGSTHGFPRGVDECVSHEHPCHTSGFGTNFAARAALRAEPDIVVLSDDDIFWRPGWRTHLEAWWTGAPSDLILTGCHLEPIFPWNAPSGNVAYGGVPGLLRASTGAATWSFRAADWSKIGPIPSRVQGWGDVPACQRVTANGYQIAQVDLAEHRGHGRSTWGNTTVDQFGWDIKPVRALLEVPV